MQGHPTYWSEYCTFSPLGVLNEHNALKKIKGLEPKLFVHPLCPVTTPYDRVFNCQLEKSNQHGSCGVGVGSTIQRQEDYYKLFVQDLFHENVLIQKLQNIKNYYAKKLAISNPYIDEKMGVNMDDFIHIVNEVKKIITVDNGSELLSQNGYDLIFEGSQGILLDQDFGFFPNVTRSNTTSKNALSIINNDKYLSMINKSDIEIYYITRSYQTRHGNGYMSNENLFGELNLKNNELETNVTNEWQGNFRKSVLDIDLLKYAFQCDSNFSHGITKHLVVTCVDQTGDIIPVTINNGDNNILYNIHIEELPTRLPVNFKNVYISRGDTTDKMSVIYLFERKTPTPLG